MIVWTLNSDDETEKDLEECARRAERLGDKAADVEAVLVAANDHVNFDVNNASSILYVKADGSGAIGARHPRGSYADLLMIPDRAIADIYYRYIVDGE